MTTAADLLVLLAVPAALVPTVFFVRVLAQRARDVHRVSFQVFFPRTVTERQVAAFLATLAGLAAPRFALVGRDSAVLEVISRNGRVEHFLRLPSESARHYVSQLRATIPGVVVTAVVNETPSRVSVARELRRVRLNRPLSIPTPAATAATVLAAASGTSREQLGVWQWVVVGGSPGRPARSWGELVAVALGRGGVGNNSSKAMEMVGMVSAVLRIGAAGNPRGTGERLARLRRAAASVSVPGGRLVPRLMPSFFAVSRLRRGATPLIEGASPVALTELAALLGWPIGGPAIVGLKLGGSPQLPASLDVPRSGRVLGDTTVEPVRPVAVSAKASTTHAVTLGPTGAGKSVLAAGLVLDDIAAGRGVTILDPKGSLVRAVAERIPEDAIDRVVYLDPTDEARPVPLPLLAPDAGRSSELAADTFITLLRHRFRDLGPRSTDILASSLYSLARMPGATILDLLRLWSEPGYRASVVARTTGDPALASFWAWFEAMSPAERSFVLAAPMNKLRPLLQRSAVRNVIASPRATFSFTGALRDNLIVLVSLPEGALGGEAAGLIGQVVLARLWAAVQARTSRRPYFVTVDEAHRFLDQPTDLGDVLAMSREYGVGLSLLTQSLAQLPERVREVAMNSARTKVAFQTSARDATRLASEFGPLVSADMLSGLAAYEAIGQVALGGAVSEPFTFGTRPLGDPIPGRLAAVRAASRERFGVPRAEIEASFMTPSEQPGDAAGGGGIGPVGRRRQP